MIQIFIKIVLVGIVSSCFISLLLVEDPEHLKYWEQVSYGVISLIVVQYLIDLCKEPLQLTLDGIAKWIINKNLVKAVYINRIHELEKELSDSKEEIDNLRAMSMDNSSAGGTTADISACREQLEEAQRAHTSGNEGHGLCSLVIRMREEGKTDTEIAEHLKDKGLSRAIVGALMARDENVIADQSYRVKADRLMKK